MKRWMLLSGALLAASLAHAQLDELSVRFMPGVSEFPESVGVLAYPKSNSNRAIYRADLARREGDVFVMLTNTSGGFDFRVSSATGRVLVTGLPPGEYRLRTYASEGPGTPELMVSKRFRVVGSDAVDWQTVRDRHWIEYWYEFASGCWQDYVATLRKRQFVMADLSGDLPLSLPVPRSCDVDPDQEGAPGGGAMIMTGEPGDGDATGAIVVTVHALPNGADDLHNLDVSITLPAYAGVPGLARQTERVAWEPGIVNPATAIANLSLRLHPASAEYALDGTPIPMWATVDGGQASFSFELERWDGTAYQREESWQGDSMIRWQPRRAGQYRLHVTAVEDGGSVVLQEMRRFRVLGPRHADYDRVRTRNTMDRNFESALAFVHNLLYSTKRKLARHADVTSEFNNLHSSASLAAAIYTPAWGSMASSPSGHDGIVGHDGGDGMGAIMLDVERPPAAIEDYDYTTVNVTYPAYAPAGTQRRTVTIRYR